MSAAEPAAVASTAVETTGMAAMTRATIVTGTAMLRGVVVVMMMVRMIGVTCCFTRSGAAAAVR